MTNERLVDLSRQKWEKQKFERLKKAAGLCPLWAEHFGTWDVRPPETPKTCSEVRCFTPVENRSERISTRRRISPKTYLPAFRKRETPRFCKTR